MGIHTIDIRRDGQTEDHLHLCSYLCQADALVKLGANSATGPGEQTREDGSTVSYGAHPGSCETDYDVWCASCGDFLWHGLECECPDRTIDREPVTVPDGELVG